MPERALAALLGLACFAALPACTPARPRNAVLIVLDTLRADHLSAYGNPRPTSPELDALAERGVLFETVVTNTPWTLPAMVGLMTGEYPSARSYHDGVQRSLVESLRSGGWATAAFTEGGFVSAGGLENDLVYGVVVNHYAPFLDDANEADGRFSFQPAPGAGISVSRTTLAAATNDLVSQIVRTNTSLKPLADSQRTDTIDGQPALSLVLVGRSAVTRGEERVTVFTRQLPDEHVVYALFIAPGQDYPALGATFNHMISSLRVNDESPHN